MNTPAPHKSRIRQWLEDHPEQVGKALVIVNYLALAALLRWAWPAGAKGTVLTIAAIVSAVLAAAQVQLWERFTGNHVPIFPPKSALDWTVWGLIAACFIAAVFVSVDERQSEAAEAQGERDRQEWHDQQRKMLDDPKVQAGFKILQQINDRRAATRNAATRSAATRSASTRSAD